MTREFVLSHTKLTVEDHAMDIPTVTALVSSFTAIKDIALCAINERDAQKLAAIKIDLTERILEGQTRLTEVFGVVMEQTGRIATLEETVRKLEAEKFEHERYNLAQIAPNRGFAYRLKPASELNERSGEPDHFLCQPCFDIGRKSVLVPSAFYGVETYTCNVCKTEITGQIVEG